MSRAAVTWVAIPVSLPNGPEAVRLRAALRSDTADAWLYRLAAWAKEAAPSGELGDFGAGIEASLGWRGSAGALWRAFLASGAIVPSPGGHSLGTWYTDVNAWLSERREKDAKRQRDRYRALKDAAALLELEAVRAVGTANGGRSDGRTVGATETPRRT